MIARKLSFAPHHVEVVGVGTAGLWVSGQDGSHWVTPEGVVLQRLDRWLAMAFESQGAWYGVGRDPRTDDRGRVCDLPHGRELFELSGHTYLPAGDRWFVDSTISASYDSTTYVVRELPSGRVTVRVEVPGTDHVLCSNRDALFVAGGGETLLEVPLAGGEARARARWSDRRWGAVPRVVADGDAVVVTAVESDGAHCVLHLPTTGDGCRELLRLPADEPPTQLLRGRRSVLVLSDGGLRSVSDDGRVTMLVEGMVQWATVLGGCVLASPSAGPVSDPFAPRPPRPVLVLPDPAAEDVESIRPSRLDTSENLTAVGFSAGHVVFNSVHGGGPVLVRLDALVEGEVRATVVDCAAADADLERAEVVHHSRDLLRLKTARYPLIEAMTSPMGLVQGDEVFVKLRAGGRTGAKVERLLVRKDGRTLHRVSTGRGLEDPVAEMTVGFVRPRSPVETRQR